MATRIAIATMHLGVAGCRSLKDKRQVIKSLLAHLHNRFNVSAAEVGDHDVWQSATIAVAVVGNGADHLDSVLSSTIRFVESDPRIELNHLETETL